MNRWLADRGQWWSAQRMEGDRHPIARIGRLTLSMLDEGLKPSPGLLLLKARFTIQRWLRVPEALPELEWAVSDVAP